jgi:PAS domain S-box-containing protein
MPVKEGVLMGLEIVRTEPNKCRQCYSCVRNCPVKAVRIKDGQAEIIQTRCIQCGNCIKHCSQNAKKVISGIENTSGFLNSRYYTVACLAPSFIASFYPSTPLQVVTAIKKLGFAEVWEVAAGAEIVARHTQAFLSQHKQGTYINAACPALVNLIERHYPALIPYLSPIVSPMIATGMMIRYALRHKNNVRIVFLGPCIAKKDEIHRPEFDGIIDDVLTFDELKQMLNDRSINISTCHEEAWDSPAVSKGRLLPLPSGFSKNIKPAHGQMAIDGKENILGLVKNFNSFGAYFIDALLCHGCIEGPKIDSPLSVYQRGILIDQYSRYDMPTDNDMTLEEIYEKISERLYRNYENKAALLPYPSEQEIQQILASTGKCSLSDELNCGACGYDSCRDKAIAVYQSIAEIEMCLPYLINRKNALLNQLSDKLNEISSLNNELNGLVECSYDGMMMTDGQGNILRTNSAWKRIVGVSDEQLPDNVAELENKRIIYPSATLLAIKEKRRITVLQQCLSGRQLVATANPISDEDGQITRVVVNIRAIDELNKLQNKWVNYNDNSSSADTVKNTAPAFIGNSPSFIKALNIAYEVADVDSTVLLLGETGVGKDIIAHFIHHTGSRKNGPFVKINCGAIPETLIESELFGYETGAFTGAKRDGKQGLFEAANHGILFLDEIAELPMAMQVKLLQAIQEKKITRIGGVKPLDVDIRIIAATNKDLAAMVKQGRFRADLYYRINVVPITIPPLRERIEDIVPLAQYFVKQFSDKYNIDKQLSIDAYAALNEYDWPGNVRELENIIERLMVTTKGDIITSEDIWTCIGEQPSARSTVKVNDIMPIKEAVEEVERQLLQMAHKRYKSTYKMAECLDIDQSTIVRKLKKYQN